MVTAADGAEDYYQTQNNEARSEGIAMALALDNKIAEIYCYHYSYFRVNNNKKTMSDKINLVIKIILRTFFGVRLLDEIHKIYLLKNPDSNIFNFLKTKKNGPKIDIKESYLKCENDLTTYVRKFVKI